MDEALQRALREAERAGIRLIEYPPELIIDILRQRHSSLPLPLGAPNQSHLDFMPIFEKHGLDGFPALIMKVREWLVSIGAAQPDSWAEVDKTYAAMKETFNKFMGPYVDDEFGRLVPDHEASSPKLTPAQAERRLNRMQEVLVQLMTLEELERSRGNGQ